MGHVDIESIDLSQDLGRENEAEDRNFQGRRQLDPQPDLHPAWHIQQHDGQNTEKRTLVVIQNDLAHQRYDHQGPQNIKDDERAFMFPQFLVHGPLERLFQPAPLFSCFFQYGSSCPAAMTAHHCNRIPQKMACDKINRSGTWLSLHNQRSADTGQTAARRASRSWVTAKKRREHTASAVKANSSHHVTPTGTRSASATTGGVTR